MNQDDQAITLLVEDKIHSLYEIKNRFGSKIITAMPVSHIRNTTSSDPRSNSNLNLKVP